MDLKVLIRGLPAIIGSHVLGRSTEAELAWTWIGIPVHQSEVHTARH
jgi:hypothetical protein